MTLANFAGESTVIVVQAATPGKGNRIELVISQLMLRMEALPMIAPKNLAGGMEFLITVGLSAIAGLLAFLFVSLIVSVLGLSGS
jgi:hypothetical protein